MHHNYETWQYDDHHIASRQFGLDGWLLCGDFNPLDGEYDRLFSQYDQVCNASSIEEAEISSELCFGKSLDEVTKNYCAWRKCKLIFDDAKPFKKILDASIETTPIIDKDTFEQLNVVTVHLTLPYFELQRFDILRSYYSNMTSTNGICICYDKQVNTVACAVALTSTEVCQETICKAIDIVHHFKFTQAHHML